MANPAQASFVDVNSARVVNGQLEMVISTDVTHSCFALKTTAGEARSLSSICVTGNQQSYTASLALFPDLQIYDVLVLETVIAPVVTSAPFQVGGDLTLHSVRIIGGTQVEVVYSMSFPACAYLQDSQGNNLSRISTDYCDVGTFTTVIVDRDSSFNNIQPGQSVTMSVFTRPDIVTNSVVVGSSPSPLPCVLSQDKLELYDRAGVIADTVYAENDILLGFGSFITGDAFGRDDAKMKPGSRVNGDLTLIGTLQQSQGYITGNLYENSPVDQELLETSTVLESNNDLTVLWDQTASIDPGRYGTVTVYDRGVLKLSKAGAYSFEGLIFGYDSKVKLDTQQGEYNIEAEDVLSFQDRFKTIPLNGPAVDGRKVHWYTNSSSVVVPYDSILRGQLWAPNAVLTVLDRGIINGCARASKITLGYDSRIQQ